MNKFISEKNSWIKTSKNVNFSNNILEAYLEDCQGNWKYNKLEIHYLLLNKNLSNDNGTFKYSLTNEEDDAIMNILFPKYNGLTIPYININKCVMLSVDIPKYNYIRNNTISILNNYTLPPLHVHYGYTRETSPRSKFYNLMSNKNQRNELTLGMLEIFDDFVNENKNTNENKWLLYFEDDVRPINISNEEDLTKLYNVPNDAELLRPYIGKNENCNFKNINYKISYSGGLNHAFYISILGCKKVLNYAKKYEWKYICDIDLYKIAKFCGGFPTGFDGWTLNSVNNNNDITTHLDENEKLIMYSLDTIIFNQTSLPCV
jgi:hypothetical protein